MVSREHLRRRALGELQHRAVGAGFRRGTWRGPSSRELRADALSRRAESIAGSSLMAHESWQPVELTPLGGIVLLGAGAALGFFLGKWTRAHASEYLMGVDVVSEVR